jgi:hypothetical protein
MLNINELCGFGVDQNVEWTMVGYDLIIGNDNNYTYTLPPGVQAGDIALHGKVIGGSSGSVSCPVGFTTLASGHNAAGADTFFAYGYKLMSGGETSFSDTSSGSGNIGAGVIVIIRGPNMLSANSNTKYTSAQTISRTTPASTKPVFSVDMWLGRGSNEIVSSFVGYDSFFTKTVGSTVDGVGYRVGSEAVSVGATLSGTVSVHRFTFDWSTT